MFSIGLMCCREAVLTGKKILFLGNLNLSFWAGICQKTIGCPCRRKRNAGFFLLRLGVNSARVLDSPLHCCCIICTHSVSLFFPLLLVWICRCSEPRPIPNPLKPLVSNCSSPLRKCRQTPASSAVSAPHDRCVCFVYKWVGVSLWRSPLTVGRILNMQHVCIE